MGNEPLIGQCSRCGGNLAWCMRQGCPSDLKKEAAEQLPSSTLVDRCRELEAELARERQTSHSLSRQLSLVQKSAEDALGLQPLFPGEQAIYVKLAFEVEDNHFCHAVCVRGFASVAGRPGLLFSEGWEAFEVEGEARAFRRALGALLAEVTKVVVEEHKDSLVRKEAKRR